MLLRVTVITVILHIVSFYSSVKKMLCVPWNFWCSLLRCFLILKDTRTIPCVATDQNGLNQDQIIYICSHIRHLCHIKHVMWPESEQTAITEWNLYKSKDKDLAEQIKLKHKIAKHGVFQETMLLLGHLHTPYLENVIL